jgi:putative spermidine/putrescine transport system substrate-binding protein
MGWVKFISIGIAGAVALGAFAANAQDKLSVSIWGGNWKDGADQAIAAEFTKRTGIKVEFLTGGTMDRLTKAKVNKDRPESDITLTTSHVGYLYTADGLFETLDMSKLPNAKDLYPVAIRSPHHIALYSYVYTPAFRTDMMPKDFSIKSWNDLWGPAVKGKLGLPDFDPSHIIVASALLSGGDAKNWKAGIPMLQKLKPSIKAFYQSDATSQELVKTGETPVQVLLTINAYHQISQNIPLKIEIPKEGGVVGLDAIAINKGTKNLEAAYKFLNTAMDAEVQGKLCGIYKCSPTNKNVKLDAKLASLPGIFTTPEQWSQGAIFIDDETRAKNFPEWKAWFTENMTR